MLRNWGALVLFLLATPVLSYAQNTGKLAGRVTDASTGEGLPGATVVLEGTTLGTATDVDGNYFIIGVPVGSYDVRASFVGYQSEIVQGVEINSGYTRELDFGLSPGVELDEIVVEYERPLIQKDAVGVPKIVSGEEITNLPVRGAAEVAAIQAGVVSQEGSETLNIRGGRGAEVTYFIDGVKVVGTTGSTIGVPQAAIQEQEILIGNISARYGDVMSGVINITTKAGAPNFFGSLEGITSEGLDAFGYNLGSATLGGPIIPRKLSFFVAAEYLDQADADPRAVEQLRIKGDVLDDLRANPIAFRGENASGGDVFLPLPATLANGATLVVDNNGNPVTDGGVLTFSDGTTVPIPGDLDLSTLNLTPVIRAEFVPQSAFEFDKFKETGGQQRLNLSGNLTYNLFDNGRLRVGGRYNNNEGDYISGTDVRKLPFAPEKQEFTRDDVQVYGTWTQYLSNSTFYQVQVDYSSRFGEDFDPRFGTDFDSFLSYGDIDDPAFQTLRGYKQLSFETEERDVNGETVTVQVPVFSNVFRDGQGPSTSDDVVSTLTALPGGRFGFYSKFHNTQFRVSASATTQIGINQVEFGGEFEQRTQRSFSISASSLARLAADGSPEGIDPRDPNQNPDGYASYDAIPAFLLDDFVSNTGYDLRGRNQVDDEDFAAFLNEDDAKPEDAYNVAPYEPIYFGGYVQDKIEFRDIVLNLGLRVDVFDNNTRTLKDPFTRRPICRVSDLGGDTCSTTLGSVPATIDDDFAVYFSGDDVVGFRDLDGRFYDASGQETNPGDILLTGKPRSTNARITPDMFEDYEPQVTVMPRIGVSFPVTDQALFFASYGITSQRPSTNQFVSLAGLTGTGRINNNNLKPEKTTKYELGFRQRLGARSALTISGFFQQIENLIQLTDIREAFPSGYSTYTNKDFGTVKGAEFAFDLRRTQGFAVNANYTLAFAQGTGSNSTTTSTIVWIDETPPNFISPLDFDQRHKMNLSLDYRLGEDEGPEIFGAQLLENFGINLLATAGSGFPFTSVVEPFNLAGGARAALPKGGVNEDRMPWSSRLDLRVDRRFPLGAGANVTAFLWVQNLLDTQNVQNVWRFTGLADDDGFLATPEGQQLLTDATPVTETLYRHRNSVPTWVGIPRMTRIGVRLDF
ncbi:MAG: TonB-dependent receptor [Rhodothermales bacterium]|nr:TonB-dependent receptor [Rhodothermales bacterium]